MDLLATAKKLAERVETEATKAKVPVAVCIVDVHGNLVLQHRMNGAPLFSLEISERKAYTSRADAYGRPALAGAAWPAALCASVGRWWPFLPHGRRRAQV